MELATTKSQLRMARSGIGPNNVVGVVPTMGGLHEGHLALVDAARSECSVVIVTIFVNPMQFGPSEDFENYPRELEDDSRMLVQRGVDLLFAPSVDEMYPNGRDHHSVVMLPHLTGVLCGRNRPGHFDGVATVVSKLFNIVQPNTAYLGQKDWQQLTIIRAMVRDLDFPLRVVGVPTVRDSRGLALSSRNNYLSVDERAKAPLLYTELARLRDRVLQGEVKYTELESQACKALEDDGFTPDYISVRESHTLKVANSHSKNRRVFGAALLGKARLIDNLAIDS
ncbi:MAG: pantoate--beta-alanine ligase [Gammaproteobacteria bacterium]|nr:pantoate--beta-alanine ligase [Gammaproteobacteria bacterium]